MKLSYVYILECSDNSYYTGVTSNLEARLTKHQSGFYGGKSYRYSRRSVNLVFTPTFTNINITIEKEKQIKKWSRTKKEALIEGRFDDLINLTKKK